MLGVPTAKAAARAVVVPFAMTLASAGVSEDHVTVPEGTWVVINKTIALTCTDFRMRRTRDCFPGEHRQRSQETIFSWRWFLRPQ